jgi:hypothetical protein
MRPCHAHDAGRVMHVPRQRGVGCPTWGPMCSCGCPTSRRAAWVDAAQGNLSAFVREAVQARLVPRTPRIHVPSSGRPRLYASNAAKQKAYRDRKRARLSLSREGVSALALDSRLPKYRAGARICWQGRPLIVGKETGSRGRNGNGERPLHRHSPARASSPRIAARRLNDDPRKDRNATPCPRPDPPDR